MGNGLSGNHFGPTVMGSCTLGPVVLSLGESMLCSILGAALFRVCTMGLVLKMFGRGGHLVQPNICLLLQGTHHKFVGIPADYSF